MNKETLTDILGWMGDRAREPSSLAGGGVIFVLVHSFFRKTELADAILSVLTGLFAIGAIVLPHPARTRNNIIVPDETKTVILPDNIITPMNSNVTTVIKTKKRKGNVTK